MNYYMNFPNLFKRLGLLSIVFSLISSEAAQKFVINNRIQATNDFNVRATPSTSGTFLFVQGVGSLGTVIGGPSTNSGYVWYNIDWDNSTTNGWSADIFLLLSAPDTISPGNRTTDGPTIDTLTPSFTWQSVNGATGYGLYIRDIAADVLVFPNAAGTTATPITGTSYPLPSGYLVAGKKYKWNLNSFSGTTEYSPPSGGNIGNRFFVTGTSPAAPTFFETQGLSDKIDLAWADNSSNETGFKIERNAGSGWSQLTTVTANTTSYSDKSAAQCVTYTYRVRAYNGINNSAYSGEVENYIHKAPGTPSGLTAAAVTTGIELKWTDNACDEQGFYLKRRTGTGGSWDVLAIFANQNVVGYTDTSATVDVTYYYQIYAYNASGATYFGDVSARRVSQYVVSVSVGSNGQLNQSGNITVNKDTDLALTATPENDYVVDQWLLDGSPAQVGGNDFTLKAIGANHTIQVTFKLKTYKLEIGGAIDDVEVFINGIKVTTAAIYNLTPDTKITVRKILTGLYKFVDYWTLDNQSGSQLFNGMTLSAQIVSDTILKAVVGTINSSPTTGGTIGPLGEPEITVPNSGTTSSEVVRKVQRSHDLVCWHDYDIDPAGSKTIIENGPCSFGSPGNDTLFARTLLDVRVHANPDLMFPIPERSALSARVTSLLDHCNADSLKLFRSDGSPNTSWYSNGIIGGYDLDEMFMTWKGEVLCSGNTQVKVDEGRIVFQLKESLKRPLELNYVGGNIIEYSGHPGYDYGESGIIVAAAKGKVISKFSGEYENRIFIEHEELQLATAYLHLKQWSKEIFDRNDTSQNSHLFYYAKEGQTVEKGQVLGLAGGAGRRRLAKFWKGDILVDNITSKLKSGSDSVSLYLMNRFSAGTRDAIAAYSPSSEQRAVLEQTLLTELNAVIYGVSIYDSARFSGVTLQKETADLLLSNDPLKLAFLNRALLEDAYPSYLSKEEQYQMDLNRFGIHLHFELYKVIVQDGVKSYVLMDPYGAYTTTGKQVYGTSWNSATTPRKEYPTGDFRP